MGNEAVFTQFIIENLQILATLGSSLGLYAFIRKGSKKDIERIETSIEKIETRLNSIDNHIFSLNNRVSRIEGQLLGIRSWEPKIHNDKEEK